MHGNHLATRTMTVVAVLLLAAGCSSAQQDRSPAQLITATTAAVATSAGTPAGAQQVLPESVDVEPPDAATPSPATVMLAPADVVDTGDDVATSMPPVDPDIGELDAGELDTLLAELDQILGDLDASFAQDEGDIFND